MAYYNWSRQAYGILFNAIRAEKDDVIVAARCSCSVQTVKKYRKILNTPKCVKDNNFLCSKCRGRDSVFCKA